MTHPHLSLPWALPCGPRPGPFCACPAGFGLSSTGTSGAGPFAAGCSACPGRHPPVRFSLFRRWVAPRPGRPAAGEWPERHGRSRRSLLAGAAVTGDLAATLLPRTPGAERPDRGGGRAGRTVPGRPPYPHVAGVRRRSRGTAGAARSGGRRLAHRPVGPAGRTARVVRPDRRSSWIDLLGGGLSLALAGPARGALGGPRPGRARRVQETADRAGSGLAPRRRRAARGVRRAVRHGGRRVQPGRHAGCSPTFRRGR